MVSGVAPPIQVGTVLPSDKSFVEVSLSKHLDFYILQYVNRAAASIRATARARVVGGNPVCMIALDEKSNQALVLTQSAKLSAPKCEIYSNSKSAKGLTVMMDASISAGAVCSAGGKYSNLGSIVPEPSLDCPVLSDPLSNRPKPSISPFVRSKQCHSQRRLLDIVSGRLLRRTLRDRRGSCSAFAGRLHHQQRPVNG